MARRAQLGNGPAVAVGRQTGVFVCTYPVAAQASQQGAPSRHEADHGRRRKHGGPGQERAYSTPLEKFHVADVNHFTSDTHWPWFERLRREDPVHYCPDSEYGAYWSVTRFQDIVTVDSNNEVFSSDSARGGIMIADALEYGQLQLYRPRST